MANLIYAKPSDELGHLVTPVLSTGTADAQYPVTNLSTFDPSHVFLTSSTGAVVVDWDHTTAKDVQIVQIVHHNLPATTVITIQRGATQGASTINTTLTVPAYPQVGLPLPLALDLTGISGYSAGGFRWTRLSWTSATKSGMGSALLWGAKRTDLVNVTATTPDADTEQQPRRIFRTAYGVSREDALGIRLRSHPATFRHVDDAIGSFLALFRDITANGNAFLWWRDPTTTDAWLAGFDADTLAMRWPFQHYVQDVPATIRELACGLAIPTS